MGKNRLSLTEAEGIYHGIDVHSIEIGAYSLHVGRLDDGEIILENSSSERMRLSDDDIEALSEKIEEFWTERF